MHGWMLLGSHLYARCLLHDVPLTCPGLVAADLVAYSCRVFGHAWYGLFFTTPVLIQMALVHIHISNLV